MVAFTCLDFILRETEPSLPTFPQLMLQINVFHLCIDSDGISLRASAKKALPFAL